MNLSGIKKFALAASLMTGTAFAGEIEVLHWWTSGGEAKALKVLKDGLQNKGHTWKDFAVAGGSGSNAMTVLKSRAVAGNPPTAAQVKGPSIQEWGEMGVLRNMNHVAEKNKWDRILPKKFAQHMKYEGNYVAVPVNVHKINWMWVNPEIFKKAGAKIPTTWEEFEVAAKKIKAAGFTPVAYGGQPWQDATVFETIALGVGGAKFYHKAFVKNDIATLKGKTMQKAFKVYRMLQKYTDGKKSSGRDWNLATAMVYKGQAAMQIMGDWAKGEFSVANKNAGIDYLAVDVPGTSGSYLYNIDSFILFDTKGSAKKAAQDDFAADILKNKFQVTFNVYKGSAPVRKGAPRKQFDNIALQSMDQINASAYSGTLLPSIAHGMAVSASVQGAYYDAVTKFYNSDMSPKEGAELLAKMIDAEL